MASEMSASSWQSSSSQPPKIVSYSSDEEEEKDEQQAASDRHLQLEAMGFSHEAIERATLFCKNPSDVLDYLLALPHESQPQQEPAARTESINGPSVGFAEQAPVSDPEFDEEEVSDEEAEAPDLTSTLINMGFSSASISAAKESCGVEAPLEKLVAFLLQHGPASSEPQKDILSQLTSLGYSEERASQAIRTCSSDELDVLVDFMEAKAMEEEAPVREESEPINYELIDDEQVEDSDADEAGEAVSSSRVYRRAPDGASSSSGKRRRVIKSPGASTSKGFGLPGEPLIPRTLNREQARRPYFYFENVRSMPSGTWDRLSGLLYGVEPEFVCARHFSVARRPRGYIHNLPLNNRKLPLPVPPKTIREFLPNTVQYTPAWDTREQLSCINTSPAASTTCKLINDRVKSGAPLTEEMIKSMRTDLSKWNLVWTGPACCSTLEAHEMERALGYDVDHTRIARSSCNKRFKSLGNAFQVDVVSYHLSVLKSLFPDGIRVLSLFSGIGGAEVALHKAGVKLKFVVHVEKDADNREILEKWWKVSKQSGGHLFGEDNVENLTHAKLEQYMKEAGGPFDLVIGGSPCNNFSGNNRRTRTGTEGEESSLCYEFPRIVNILRRLT